jgi:hypothetical protein
MFSGIFIAINVQNDGLTFNELVKHQRSLSPASGSRGEEIMLEGMVGKESPAIQVKAGLRIVKATKR